MSFVPYLFFQGTCADAMAFYKEVFGGHTSVATFADAPPGAMPEMPPEAMALTMHAELKLADGAALMASDFPPGMPGAAQAAVSVSWPAADVEAGRTLHARLAEGGEVMMPYAETFWAEGFGMVRDRFGTHWMISGPQKPMG